MVNILGVVKLYQEGSEMAKRKSWREKLEDKKDLPKVVPIPENMQKRMGEGTMVIPAPGEVEEIMSKIPRGKLITINEMREILAKKHGATTCCPITTGIFARIAAEVAAEEDAQGKKMITPYWRTLRSGGELNPKYPGGINEQKKRLEAEGHRVIQKGKKYVVKDFEDSLLRELRT